MNQSVSAEEEALEIYNAARLLRPGEFEIDQMNVENTRNDKKNENANNLYSETRDRNIKIPKENTSNFSSENSTKFGPRNITTKNVEKKTKFGSRPKTTIVSESKDQKELMDATRAKLDKLFLKVESELKDVKEAKRRK